GQHAASAVSRRRATSSGAGSLCGSWLQDLADAGGHALASSGFPRLAAHGAGLGQRAAMAACEHARPP
ncbi:trm4a, partial [Symbiodinium sp. CCMP2456]